MIHQGKLSIVIILLLIIFSGTSWGSKIVRPWRSTTGIVKAGENFDVWFDADNGQTVNSVELQGLYHSANTIIEITKGDWEYDQLSKNRYNTKIVVSVPVNTPADRYDLILKTSSGEEVSYGAVKVVLEFKENYYVMHMSDGHFYQHGYDTYNLMARKTEMIKIANIIDCQIIIETGDNMYNVRNHPEREREYFRGVESEDIMGIAQATAATFLVPGDHDAYTANDWPQATVQVNSDFFNDYWGLQNSSFKYGNGRYMMLNNAWGVSTSSGNEHQYQCTDAVNWLKNEGSGGNFFVSAGHCYDKMHEFIDDDEKLDLVLAGDKHHVRNDNPFPFDTGSKEIAYIAGAIRDHFEFNLFEVNNSNGSYSPVSGTTGVVSVIKSGNQDNRSTWISYLTLTYSNENNGNSIENRAIISNSFDFPLNNARVRFVMPKGNNYIVSKGIIDQQFEGDNFKIVDVSVSVDAKSSVEIDISIGDNYEHNLAVYKESTQVENLPLYAGNFSPAVVVRNLGESEENNTQIVCKIKLEGSLIYSDSTTMNNIKPRELISIEFEKWIPNKIGNYEILFISDLSTDQDRASDTLKVNIAVSNILDDFENGFENWKTDVNWGIDNRQVYDGEYSMAINPGLRYENSEDSYALYNYTFDLTSITNPQLTFWSQTVLADGDTGFVEISTDGGSNWDRLGNGFSGLQSGWVHNTCSLKNYTGFKDIRFRFHFISDDSKTHLGWFIDDVKIEDGLTGFSEKKAGNVLNQYTLFHNYPNPFNPETIIRYNLAAGRKVSLKIYDTLGREVRTLVDKHQAAGEHSVTFKAGNLSSGVYIYILKAGAFEQSQKMILLR